jgi:hypothetical protein
MPGSRARTVLLAVSPLLAACASIPTTQEAGVSYATVGSPWPEDGGCVNARREVTGIAKEVLLGSRRTVVVAGGPRPIGDDEWPGFSPGLGNRKNSDRHLLFSRSCFHRSPGRPASCEGEACAEFVELGGYTWLALSKVEAGDCLPDPGRCRGTEPQPGGLFVAVTSKCHELVFEGEAIFLRGPRGERAVMHATADGTPRLDAPLPAGWSLAREPLPEPLVVHPFGGGDACFYNIVRDAFAQAYHQLDYAGPTYP